MAEGAATGGTSWSSKLLLICDPCTLCTALGEPPRRECTQCTECTPPESEQTTPASRVRENSFKTRASIMKKKIKNSNSVRKVPTAAEVRAQGTIVLSIQQIDPDDPSLPPRPERS